MCFGDHMISETIIEGDLIDYVSKKRWRTVYKGFGNVASSPVYASRKRQYGNNSIGHP
jgi:hypothetical protein